MESQGSDFSEKNEESILRQSNMKAMILELLPISGKITDQKLDLEGRQYIAWRRAIQFFFDEVDMSNHLTRATHR